MYWYRSVSDRMLIWGAQDKTNPKHGEKIGMALWQKENLVGTSRVPLIWEDKLLNRQI